MNPIVTTVSRTTRPFLAVLAFSVIISRAAYSQEGEKPLYLDPTQSVEKRTGDLISRLTLEEKATLLNHNGPDVERLGIRSARRAAGSAAASTCLRPRERRQTEDRKQGRDRDGFSRIPPREDGCANIELCPYAVSRPRQVFWSEMNLPKSLTAALDDLLTRAFAEEGEDITSLAVFGPAARVAAKMVCRQRADVSGGAFLPRLCPAASRWPCVGRPRARRRLGSAVPPPSLRLPLPARPRGAQRHRRRPRGTGRRPRQDRGTGEHCAGR